MVKNNIKSELSYILVIFLDKTKQYILQAEKLEWCF
jgi:hypothetical protein